MLNPESVILNLVQNLQGKICSASLILDNPWILKPSMKQVQDKVQDDDYGLWSSLPELTSNAV